MSGKLRFISGIFKIPTDKAHLLHLMKAEKNVSMPRFVVILLNSVIFIFIDKADTIPGLVYPIMTVAVLYSLYLMVFKSYRKYTIFLTGYFTTITEVLLISLWLVGTGGYDSPFYPLWYVSILAIAFRFSFNISMVIALFYSICYLGIVFWDPNPIQNPEFLAIRIGYIFVMALFGGLLSTDAMDQIQSNFQIKKSQKRAKAAELKLRSILIDLENEIEERKKTEAVLQKQTMELAEAKGKAEHSERSKEQFLSNMSHEIRTPLNGIIGFTKLLEDTQTSDTQKSFIDVIKNSGELLLAIVNDILDISKINAGKMRFEQTPFLISETIDNVTELLQAKVMDKSISLVKNIDPDLNDCAVLGDPVRFNQVIINLMNNAIKFTSEGSITVGAKLLKDKGDSVQIECWVQDTGIGIRKEKLANIFQRFTQADSDTTRKFGGTGLGLSIVKNLIELQGGKIWAESEELKGTTFFFRLEFKKGTKLPSVRKKEDRSEATMVELEGVRVLLVDDNEINQLLGKTILNKSGMLVDLAGNGEDAIKKLEENEYQIVLMDVQMPRMDGHQATRYIREKMPSPLNRIPVIAMTAGVGEKEVQKCYQAGMDEYISKPFNTRNLLLTIRSFVKKSPFSFSNSLKEVKAEGKVSESLNPETGVTDLTQLENIGAGNKDFVVKMLTKFLESMPGDIQKLKEAFESCDREKLGKISHKMKSSVAVVGMFEAQKNLKRMEIMSMDGGSLEEIGSIKAKVLGQYEKAIVELNEVLEKLK